MSRLSASGPHRASLWRRLRPRENAATLLRGARACLALLAAAALLALAAPAQAQTEVWTATLTPATFNSGFIGCSNEIGDTPVACSTATVLSDDDFTHDSTDYSVINLYLSPAGALTLALDADITTATAALTLVVGTTSLALADAETTGPRFRIWSSPGLSWTAGTAIDVKLTAATTTNAAPTVANPIDDQTATVGTALNFTFPTNTFADTDAGATLTYTAIQSDDSALPAWLSFAAATRTFSGTPTAAGTVSVKVTASDGTDSVSDTFDIVVSAAVPGSANVLVSNVGQSEFDGIDMMGTDLAQSFTTGDDDAGYTLTSIELRLVTATPAGASPTVKLFRGSATGTEVATLIGPTMLDAGATENYAFTPSTTVNLLTSTTYWVVGEGGFAAWTYTSTSEDATSATGWTIADAREERAASSTGGFMASTGTALHIRVNGTPGSTTVTNAAPTVANPIDDQTAMVGTALNFAFPTNTFADTDAGATLTYTATQSDDSVLPSWLSFDAATRTFSGTPTAVETVSVKVTASDGTDSVSDTFDIVVSAGTTANCAGMCLVSNVGQTGIIDIEGLGSEDLAQSFTTGDNATGYNPEQYRASPQRLWQSDNSYGEALQRVRKRNGGVHVYRPGNVGNRPGKLYVHAGYIRHSSYVNHLLGRRRGLCVLGKRHIHQ